MSDARDPRINQVTISGNLVRQPDIRYTGSGTAVANMTVALNRGSGAKKETAYIKVTCWKDLAERVAGYPVGHLVVVEGRMSQENWEQDGQKKSKTGVTAFKVTPLVWDSEPSEMPPATPQRPVSEPVPEDDIPF